MMDEPNEVNMDTGIESGTALNETIESLKHQLEKNPFDYNAHTRLIECLRKTNDSERVKYARERMHDIYPLTPAIWLQWIEDELRNASTSEEKRQVEVLFKRAVDDYEDVNVWLEYCHFAISTLDFNSMKSMQEAEAIFESALSHQGLNVAGGSILWEIYREYLTIVWSQLSQKDQELKSEQVKKMDRLFRRQLSIPLLNMEQTLIEYQTSYLISVKTDYEKALDHLSVLLPFEEAIEEANDKSESEAISSWNIYLDWAVHCAKRKKPKTSTKNGDVNNESSSTTFIMSPNELCCLFERAITAHCLDTTLWIRYADYVESQIENDIQRLQKLLARSVRNCPWCVELWQRYALITEAVILEGIPLKSNTNGAEQESVSRESDLFKEVDGIYETALVAGFTNPGDVLKIWRSYCDHHLRRLCSLEKTSLSREYRLSLLRATFGRAIEYCFELLRAQPNTDWSLLNYYAFVEAKHAENKERARSLWTSLMKLPGHGTRAEFWIAYIQFEQNWDHSELLFQVVLCAIGEIGVPVKQYRDIVVKINTRRGLLTDSTKDNQSKKSNVEVAKSTTDHNLPNAKKRKLPQQQSDSSQSTAAKVPKTEPTSHGTFVPHDPSKNDLTVFVSNLDYSTSEDQLRETFEKCGELTSVRLVRDYAGRSKGYAYVEFKNKESVKPALELDRQCVVTDEISENEVENVDSSKQEEDQLTTASKSSTYFRRPMFVSICDPSKVKSVGFKYTVGKKEPEKLFVRNLDKNVKSEDLEKLFKQYGEVVSIRLATYRNGVPKGHAYIEFSNANDASKALVATDGLKFGSKLISVAISEPPVRGNVSQSFHPSSTEGSETFKTPHMISSNRSDTVGASMRKPELN
ncbi:unnamed protein product [Heterobilharzia americana]|nr:unnamed protein product [Heterobilharzia americana]